jgi:DNA topoisomerase I
VCATSPRLHGAVEITRRATAAVDWSKVPVVHNTTGEGDWVSKRRHPLEGKWIYTYPADRLAENQKHKFEENRRFARVLPEIRARYAEDLAAEGTKKQVLALIVALIDQAYLRVGNECSAGKDVHGATTLRKRHIRLDGETAIFDYVGKKKIEQHHVVCDERIAEILRGLLERCRHRDDFVFMYGGKKIRAAQVNAYLAEFGVTAKQFRTYHATRIARELLLAEGKVPEDRREDVIKKVVQRVADQLGHEEGTSKEYYIDPEILDRFRRGRLK